MVTITIDGETFEADTLAEARKLARKAERAAQAARKAEREAIKVAQGRAKESGYYLYEMGLRPEGPPRGIRFYAAGGPYFSGRVKEWPGGDTATYETENGRAEFRHYGYRVTGFVRSGAGFDLGVVLQDTGRPEGIEFLAVGTADGAIAFERISYLAWDVFAHESEASESATA